MKRKKLISVALFAIAAGVAATALAFPFWLEAPDRSNKYDQGSYNWIRPTATPAPVAGLIRDTWDPGDDTFSGAKEMVFVGVASASHKVGNPSDVYDFFTVDLITGKDYDITVGISGAGTATLEYMGVVGSTVISSNGPSAAPIISLLSVGSSTTYMFRVSSSAGIDYTLSVTDVTGASPSFTNTPPPSATNTPVIATLTNTPFIPSGNLLDDFEDGDLTDNQGGAIVTDSDAVTTINLVQTNPGSTLPGGSSGNSFCMNGTINPPPPFPWGVTILDLAAGGSAVDLIALSTNQSIKFSYKANSIAGGPVFRFRLSSLAAGHVDTDYYKFDFTPLDTLWHEIVVYFPGQGGANEFAQVGWGAAVPWAASGAAVKAVEIVALEGAAIINFDLCFDDIDLDGAPLPATATPSFTNSPTPVYSPTASPTPVAGFSGLWYDGETAGALLADITASGYGTVGEVGIQEVVAAGQGAGASSNYLKVTFGVSAYYGAGAVARAEPAGEDVSPFNQLDFWMRVPTGTGGCFNGGVVLGSSQAPPNAVSRSVTITPYIVGGGPVTVGVWHHVVIPLSAFGGDNHGGGVMTIPADLGGITTVRFQPYYTEYDATGAFAGEVEVDSIQFNVGAAAEKTYSALFADFESSNASNWNTYWSAYSDRDDPIANDSSTCIINGDPDGQTMVTSISFPAGANPPIDAGGGADTPCFAAHHSGVKGDDGDRVNPWSDPSGCDYYSSAGFGAGFNTVGTMVDVTSAAYLGYTPSAIRFKAKSGATHPTSCVTSGAGQNYLVVFITNDLTELGSEFQHRISSADLAPLGTWVTITIPFPAVGMLGKSGNIDTGLGQPSWAVTEIPWSFNLIQMSFAPETDECAFDIWIDDIEFMP